ncbi:hypothetical protein PRZ48_010383 [Zasmidium cellare]|uniref:F-box domain-containing protein n=1 Tax=Zasmidium cellare TaxID=395010 RepID=A0ABR0E8N2_ZASCE|nr:hypothetical protein PRZ48_010383 [Zasmidium cellare]
MPGVLSLPRELRDIILDCVAQQDILVLQQRTVPPRLLPSSGIFLASRQLHAEYQEILDKIDRSNIKTYHTRFKVSQKNNRAASRHLPAQLGDAEGLYIDIVYDCSGLDMTPELDPLACTSSTMAWPRSRSVRNHFLWICRDLRQSFIFDGAHRNEYPALKRVAVNISFRGITSQGAGVEAMSMRLGAELSHALIHSMPSSVVAASMLGPGGVGHFMQKRDKAKTSTKRLRRGVLYTGALPEWAELLRELKAERSVSLVLAARKSNEMTEMDKAISRALVKADVDWWAAEPNNNMSSLESNNGLSQEQRRDVVSNPFAVLEEGSEGE